MEKALHKTSASIEFIRSYYLEKKKLNPHYTVPSFARDLGVSKSYLWRLLNGERPLTVKQAIQMAAILGLTAKRTDDLIAQIVLESGKNSKVSKVLRAKVENRKTAAESLTHYDIERFKVISQWQHLAILNLIRVKGFRASSAWIAKRLGISTLEAEDSVDRLLKVGLVKRERSTLKRTEQQFFVNSQKPSVAMSKHLEQMSDKAKEAMKDTSQEAFQNRFIAGITLPADPAKIAQLKARLQEIQMEFLEPITSQENTAVYQINLQLFPLTQKDSQS